MTKMASAIAVDLGSDIAGVWTDRQGVVSGRCDSAGPLIRRGRVVDFDGCVAMLSQLVGTFAQPVPSGGVVVACRPVLASGDDQETTRRVLKAVFEPSRLLLIDSVRAAAMGAGETADMLLVADVGAELTEVAVLDYGRVVEARRSDIGTRDLSSDVPVDVIVDHIAAHVDSLDVEPPEDGLLLVGDGALHPGLVEAVAARLGIRVHRAADPRTAALNGAGKAAMSLLRHPGAR
ncbi:rod shape-determining protein MreB [Actinoplanes philippinensis]|uniref:Rod shape-determining protein MreB n=2 Tax=Actinoplanes philippinensis TaxID=35752 RepID=A0A1I2E380_9ACTN|nr:rod shape-determining protein MreB [Actinoplanes philippinensis]